MSIRMEYGSGSYGEGLYGGAPTTSRNNARVGTDFEITLNGVGLKILPKAKSYDKHAAQTFSYNPKSLFKQGDGAALVAKDLYYWSRLEHSKWDGGETYEPWIPDVTDPMRLNHKYSQSFGFDVTDPHRLTHLREVYVAPSYEFVVQQDTPLAYWLLADHTSTDQMYDQIASNRTPGTYIGTVIRDILPSPIAYDPNTIAAFDGSTGYASTGINVKKVPFAGNVTPVAANPWSLEAWLSPATLPTNEVAVLIGSEVLQIASDYRTVIVADGPVGYWRLGEAEVNADVDGDLTYDEMGNNNLHIHPGPTPENIEFGEPGAIAGNTSVLMDNDGQIAFIGGGVDAYPVSARGYLIGESGADFSMEAWVYPTALNQSGTIMINWGNGYSTQGFVTQTWGMHHGYFSPGFNAFQNTDDFSLIWHDHGTLTSGYHFPAANAWYYCVITRVAGTWHFYVNGVEVGTPQVQATYQTEREGFSIGGKASADVVNYKGRIDEAALYSYALTAAQILAHYNAVGGQAGIDGGGFGIAINNGAGASGSKLVARLPSSVTTSGWIDSGYTFPLEGSSAGWVPWWEVDNPSFIGGTATGAWYHVVLTYDGTSIRFYVNGSLKNTVAAVPKSIASWATMGADATVDSAGVVSGLGKFFKGLMCQIAVYNTTLSGATVLRHYNAGIGDATIAALISGQTYARFVETYDGTLFINQKNTNMLYSTDGGAGWTKLAMPESDVTDFRAIWPKGTKVYAATANNIYVGDSGGFVELNNVNPDITGVTAGMFYSGQIYVGIGTSLYYVDPATGLTTQLYDTTDFTVTFIEAFQGKIWFGGTNGRMTRLWTWTNNTLPPSPANGNGTQVQDGTLPYGFIARSSTVYLNTLLIGGTIAGDTTSEGQGAVYYITSAGALGQLCILGPLMKDIRGTGLDYGVRTLWGAQNMLWMGYSYNTGIARYDFGPGAFSSHVTRYSSRGNSGQKVLAVAFFNGKGIFATNDGYIWKESNNKVTLATLEESEFHELPFLDKTIDGIEGRHTALIEGQRVQVELSFDGGATWSLAGENAVLGSDNFDFPQVAVRDSHWKSRVKSYRGGDALQAPEIDNWSIRFAPQNSPKHEWLIECYLPVIQRTATGAVLTNVGKKLMDQLWAARENGIVVDFTDRDSRQYKVLVIEMHQNEINARPVRASAQQLQMGATLQVELLEVQRIS